MAPVVEVKVQSIWLVFDAYFFRSFRKPIKPNGERRDGSLDGVLVRVVLQNKLLEEEKSPLVIDLLPNLHARDPVMDGLQLHASFAHLIVNNVVANKALLENSSIENLIDRLIFARLASLISLGLTEKIVTSFWIVSFIFNLFE